MSDQPEIAPALTECPHCHDSQMVYSGDAFGGIVQGCACLNVEYRKQIGLPLLPPERL